MILSRFLDTFACIMESQQNKEDLKMTTSIGFYFVIFILASIPFVFLGAGKDTTHTRAVRKQCYQDALLDWTDKDALAAEHEALTTPRPQPKLAGPAKVEVITRDVTGLTAA